MTFNHETVLLHEMIDSLNVVPNGIYVDCTLGGCGHAQYLLSLLDEEGHLYAFDQDLTALENAKQVLADDIQRGRVTLIHSNFSNLKDELEKYNVNQVDGIYYDLGVSSPQFDIAERGFSYQHEGQLDMRMNQSQALDAHQIVNEWSESELSRIIRRYGEERFSGRIARQIVESRKNASIDTTLELSELVKQAIPAATRRKGGHPAKRTFQAIRIAVNNELGVLEASLEAAVQLLKEGGRISVISFHSLEDRIVKGYFRELSAMPETPPNMPMIPEELLPKYRMVSRKPIEATQDELEQNRRARSARLRVLERIRA